MPKILDRVVNLAFPLGHHLHCLVAQLPIRLRRAAHGYEIADPEAQWRTVRSVLDLVAEGEQNLKKLHFLVLPEAAVPFSKLDDLLEVLERQMRPNSVTMFGLEHVRLRTYRDLLARFSEENAEAIELVERDVDSGDVLLNPVNAGCVVVKEATGRVRVFFEAKSHPFAGEEVLDSHVDLYRGRHFYLFRSEPACFNFMVLVCLDYLYRSLYASNIREIIDHANQLFFRTRQTLDALFVLQTNPKPEHAAYRDVLSGFYGEYLEDTPGVRETVTVFGNASDESAIDGYTGDGRFGTSSIVINRHHKLARIARPEFSTDDFGGAPLCRLRFGTGTRLFYFNLPLHHELDPRSSRLPLKVHRIMQPAGGGAWEQVSGDRLPSELVLPRLEGD
ncbi:MAG TPA: hypothetical protein VLT61_06690 [Anaeromyxobacteraceae bacterium]|nr:hypothetical protein [Anaeromyxobacteraceae bacterium]